MKNITRIFSILAAASLLFAACTQEEAYVPGEPDVDGCYAVYFPSQEASGYHVYTPTMDPSIDIKVTRRNTKGAITVPVEVSCSEEGLFTAGTLSFADGQSETTLKVSFPNLKPAVKYNCTVAVTDPQYASYYKEGATYFDFQIMSVEYKYFLNPKTNDKALITFYQGWWGEIATGYIKYYEVDGYRHCETETLTHSYKGAEYEGYGFLGCQGSAADAVEWTFNWYPSMKNVNGHEMIELPTQFSGYHNSNYDADVYVFDIWHYYNDIGGNSYDWKTYAAKYSLDPNGDYPVGYYDGEGGFAITVHRYYMLDLGGWNPGAYDIWCQAEGFDAE